MHIVRPILVMVLAGTMIALGDPNFDPQNPSQDSLKEKETREEQIQSYRYDVPPEDKEEEEEREKKEKNEEKE